MSAGPGSLRNLIEEAQTLSSRADDDPNAAQALKDLLVTLQNYEVTTQLLVETQAGKKVRKLTKHGNAAVAQAAAATVAAWKEAVAQEATRHGDGSAANGERSSQFSQESSQVSLPIVAASSAAAGAAPDPNTLPPAKRQKSAGLGPGSSAAAGAASTASAGAAGHRSGAAANGTGAPGMSASAAAAQHAHAAGSGRGGVSGAAEPIVVPKTGDPARDKTRQLFAEALALARDDVAGANIGAAAAEVEGAMHRQNGGVNPRYKAKYRSLIFNLKDASNPDLRRRVLSGEIPGEVLVELPAEELASDARKNENAAIRKHALNEAERGQHMKQATTDQFQCGKCRQRKTQYYQMQTRSADEPMTTFVTCINCGNRWKFC